LTNQGIGESHELVNVFFHVLVAGVVNLNGVVTGRERRAEALLKLAFVHLPERIQKGVFLLAESDHLFVVQPAFKFPLFAEVAANA
jgi:hypothetical protein